MYGPHILFITGYEVEIQRPTLQYPYTEQLNDYVECGQEGVTRLNCTTIN